jgi:hypothetical protein
MLLFTAHCQQLTLRTVAGAARTDLSPPQSVYVGAPNVLCRLHQVLWEAWSSLLRLLLVGTWQYQRVHLQLQAEAASRSGSSCKCTICCAAAAAVIHC